MAVQIGHCSCRKGPRSQVYLDTLCNVGVLNIYVGLGPCVYRAYPWYIMMSNSLKSSSFHFWGLPQDFNPHNPYNHGSTGHLASDMKEYPEIDPDNFTETPDRKSTRLNSSHTVISYAVFCL